MTRKRIVHKSIGILLGVVLLVATSACAASDTSSHNSNETASQQSSTSSAERTSSSVNSETPSSQVNTPASFQAHNNETDDQNALGYWLYTPENPTENMPLIVYLHGASGRGDDLNVVVADDDFPKYLQTGELGDVRAYVLMPQLPADVRSWCDKEDELYNLIQKTVSSLPVDAENISLAGFSMGGTATWELAAKYPNLFIRIAPLAGSAREVLEQVSTLQNIPVRAFVGTADVVISPNSSEQMVAKLQKAGADACITAFNGADHVSVPPLVYHDENIALVDWLIGANES